ncbi:hypothetical protein NM688_g6037 [Phlebia brevispora]|uniref:Uncharacterized protein n=1 Tax=Phlebia brevispora TaxID=194682 RepID=A0ACC1SKV5_9APHY|nr:hypothetical protein NM688_g6037 [Phlebia brevispora]
MLTLIDVQFSMISLLVKEKLYINEVVLGTAFGILMGPHCANIFDPRSWNQNTNTITLEVMRVVLATGLFAIGVELPQSYLADHAKGLLIMVVPTMAFGWVVVAAITYALFPPLNFISALAIAACLTPTDPIICAAIVGGKFAIKHVPTNLRRIISAESAANDGLAYPFLSISLYLTLEASTGTAIAKWFLIGWLYQVILGVILGAVMGLLFSKFMKFSYRKGFIDRESYVAQFLALALFTIGVVSTIGSDDLLAAFAAGSAISWDGHFNMQIENEVFSSVIDLVLNCGCFVYIGAWLPFDSFNTPDLGILPWRLVVLFIAILFLRRIPALLVLYRWVPEISGWKEAMFSGHFGPMGVGAVFVSTLALTRLPEPHYPPRNQQEYLAATLQTIVSFVVFCSILIHGLSIPFFSFSRRIHSRTVSMSRTWTSRTTTLPDWLLGAHRVPPENVRETSNHSRTASTADLEGGQNEDMPKDITHPAAVHCAHARDADASVVPQNEVPRTNAEGHLGPAGMLEGPEDNQPAVSEANLRRRFASVEDVSITPPSDTNPQVRSDFDQCKGPFSHRLHHIGSGTYQHADEGADTGGSREDNADFAAHLTSKLNDPSERPHIAYPHPGHGILTRRSALDDEDGSHPPSGVQTPTKMVSGPSLAYIVLGGFVVMFSMMSLLVKEKLYVNEVVLGTAVGIIMGPYCAKVFDPRSWGEHSNMITLEVMRVVLATGLFAIGLIIALFPDYTIISALAIAACLTPTDPIICAAIVGGKFANRHVPQNLRHLIAAESAANDGLAYPFLTFALYLTVESSYRTALGKWVVIGCLYQVVFGTVIGAMMGLGFCKLMKLSHRLGFIDQESYVAQYLALAIFAIGVVSTIGSDDLLATFAAGSAIAWDGDFKIYTEDELFSSVIDLILNCGCFVYIGAWMPFEAFNSPDLGITLGRLFALLFAIMLLRRIPALLLLYRWVPEIEDWKEALFSGHFGPMGVGAVFVSTLALTRLPTPQSPPYNQSEHLAATLQIIVSFVVLGSIFIRMQSTSILDASNSSPHDPDGLSIPFFSAGRRLKSRTMSSRSWTTRNSVNHTPDWLLGVNKLPLLTHTAGAPGGSSFSPDLEPGVTETSECNSGQETGVANIPIVAYSVGGRSQESMTTTNEAQAMHANDDGIRLEGRTSEMRTSPTVLAPLPRSALKPERTTSLPHLRIAECPLE